MLGAVPSSLVGLQEGSVPGFCLDKLSGKLVLSVATLLSAWWNVKAWLYQKSVIAALAANRTKSCCTDH